MAGKISQRIGGTDEDDVSGRDRDLYRAGDRRGSAECCGFDRGWFLRLALDQPDDLIVGSAGKQNFHGQNACVTKPIRETFGSAPIYNFLWPSAPALSLNASYSWAGPSSTT